MDIKVLEAFKKNIKQLRVTNSTQKPKRPSLNHSVYESSKQYTTAKKLPLQEQQTSTKSTDLASSGKHQFISSLDPKKFSTNNVLSSQNSNTLYSL